MNGGGIRAWVWRALIVLIACLLAVILPPIVGHAAEANAGAAPQGVPNVVLPQILAPMIARNRLEGYAYLTVALAPANAGKVAVIREKMPFIQDAFLRAVNKATIVKPDDFKSVDVEEVKKRLETQVAQVLPAGTVKELKIDQVVVALFGS